MKRKYSYQEPNQDLQPLLAPLQSNSPKLLPQQFLSQQDLQLPRIPGGPTTLPPPSTVPWPTHHHHHHHQPMQPTLTNHCQTRPLLPLPFPRQLPPPHQEPPQPTLLSASNNPFIRPPTSNVPKNQHHGCRCRLHLHHQPSRHLLPQPFPHVQRVPLHALRPPQAKLVSVTNPNLPLIVKEVIERLTMPMQGGPAASPPSPNSTTWPPPPHLPRKWTDHYQPSNSVQPPSPPPQQLSLLQVLNQEAANAEIPPSLRNSRAPTLPPMEDDDNWWKDLMEEPPPYITNSNAIGPPHHHDWSGFRSLDQSQHLPPQMHYKSLRYG